ncbi:unnamed protein product, partial [Ilex paraguariensis]
MSVLSKENSWINLEKLRKSFEDAIRTILITLHCLHFVKKNPESSGKALWDHLSKIFSSYEAKPSQSDLVDHTDLISEAVQRDEALAKSKFLGTILEEKPRKRKSFDEAVGPVVKSGFTVDNDMIDEIEEDGSYDEEGLFDYVCTFCDNGGELLCCEGRCLRSFHATKEAGSDSMCQSLGFSDEQVEAIQNFFCENCQYKQHQCFSCGGLGSSDKSSGAKVKEARLVGSAGLTITVIVEHIIHNKSLRLIAFEDIEEEGTTQRAWEGLIPNRILIYCLKHEIDDELVTPMRNHIKFPWNAQREKNQASELQSSREKVAPKRRSLVLEEDFRKRTVVKTQKGFEKLSSAIKQGDSLKESKGILYGSNSLWRHKVMDTSRKTLNKTSLVKVNKSNTAESRTSLGKRLYDLNSKDFEAGKSRKDGITDSVLEQTQTVNLLAKEASRSPPLDADAKRRWHIDFYYYNAASSITLEEVIEKHKVPTTHASSKTGIDKTINLGKVEGSIEALRAALHKLEEGCSIEDAKPACEPGLLYQIMRWKLIVNSSPVRWTFLRAILENSVVPSRKEQNSSNKLKVYLAPFLHGMRYTSFGRHFTKVDKLQEIMTKGDYNNDYDQREKESQRWCCSVPPFTVSPLHGEWWNLVFLIFLCLIWIVDFCCGSNDFSCIMKEKLDEMGKHCSYKNYDILQAKHDFNFEKRDWMSVHPKELPTGSQLIMGLNPPFGVNARLANKLINKALEFKPKLLVLTVPRETE